MANRNAKGLSQGLKNQTMILEDCPKINFVQELQTIEAIF